MPFHVNLPTTIITKCMENPTISKSLKRFPIIVPDGARHVANYLLLVTIICIFSYDQMYEAEKWHEDMDLQAPMIILPCNSHLFVGQFVTVQSSSYIGKVMKFVQLVSQYSHNYLYIL